jgi:hypothetical protein
MKSAADIWICKVCRSINPLSSGRCYRCSTPVDVAAAKPDDLTLTHTRAPIAPTGTYRSSETRAVVVSLATMLFIPSALLALWVNWQVWDLRVGGDLASALALIGIRLPALLAAIGVGFVALLSYAAWIRRTVENLPALGAGYSRVSPTWAFFEPLIPGFNFFALPARMSEVIDKLGGHRSALPLLGLAALLVLTPAGILYFALRAARLVLPTVEFFRFQALGVLVMFGFQAIALAIGLVVLWQIEGLARRTAEELAARPLVASGAGEPGPSPDRTERIRPI